MFHVSDPVPKKKWTGIMDCKNYGPVCFQKNMWSGIVYLDEDCLYLNVFTRTIDEPNTNNPVIVFIHGGGFMFGSGDDEAYGPEHLIRQNIVLVTFNYRLGVLGFLDLEDEIAAGNQGLKDQVMVLQWIQQNIRIFGGDPGNVTVFGYSSGGSAAHYLALSPLTKGLMHKVISQACVLYNTWVSHIDSKANAIKLCSLLGEELADSKKIFKFLKKVDAKSLLEAQIRLTESIDTMPFGPGTDSKSPNPLMPIAPQLAADQGAHLPYLAGWNDREGLIILIRMSRESFLKSCDLDFARSFRYNLNQVLVRYNLDKTQVKKFYFGDEAIAEHTVDKLVDFATDFFFIEPVHRFARAQADCSSASTYLYQFCYDQSDSYMKAWMNDFRPGATFMDDLPFLFKTKWFEPFKKGTRKYKMMEQMTEMWVNFATHGKPTVEISELTPVHWLPLADGTTLRFLNVDKEITMQSTVNVDKKLCSIKSMKAKLEIFHSFMKNNGMPLTRAGGMELMLNSFVYFEIGVTT